MSHPQTASSEAFREVFRKGQDAILSPGTPAWLCLLRDGTRNSQTLSDPETARGPDSSDAGALYGLV